MNEIAKNYRGLIAIAIGLTIVWLNPAFSHNSNFVRLEITITSDWADIQIGEAGEIWDNTSLRITSLELDPSTPLRMFEISPRRIELYKVVNLNTDPISISVFLDFYQTNNVLKIGTAKGTGGTINIKVSDSTGVQINEFNDTSGDGSPFDYMVFQFNRPTGINIEKDNSSLNDFDLEQNYPNPFNPNTTIVYSVESNDVVKIRIFNDLGQLVKTLINEKEIPGRYKTIWDGTDNSGNKLSSGTYFYQLIIGDRSEARKMILLK